MTEFSFPNENFYPNFHQEIRQNLQIRSRFLSMKTIQKPHHTIFLNVKYSYIAIWRGLRPFMKQNK